MDFDRASITSPGPLEIDRQSPRRFAILIGNLSWWTTDRDVELSLLRSGVDRSEVKDISFGENKHNGQSKGYLLIMCNLYHQMCLATIKLLFSLNIFIQFLYLF